METTLEITPAADAELGRLLAKRAADTADGLVLGVRKGGCAGWQYTMQIAAPAAEDVRVSGDEAQPVYLAADSVEKLSGCRLDYSDALSDAGFKITNPNAARSCGCGTSFETAEEAENSTYDPSMDGVECT